MDMRKIVNALVAIGWIVMGVLSYANGDMRTLLFIILFSQGVRLVSLSLEKE